MVNQSEDLANGAYPQMPSDAYIRQLVRDLLDPQSPADLPPEDLQALMVARGQIAQTAYLTLRRIGGPAVPHLLEAWGGSFRVEQLILAIGADGTEAITRWLEDADSGRRQIAAHLLGRIKTRRAVNALIARLIDPNTQVRRTVIWALGEIGDPRAVEPLITCLHEPSPQIRASAAAALGKLGDMRAVEPLRQVSDADPAFDVVTEALHDFETPIDAQRGRGVQAGLPSSDDWRAAQRAGQRERAAQLLAAVERPRRGQRTTAHTPVSGDDIPALLDLLAVEDKTLCTGVIRHLALLSDDQQRAVTPITEVLESVAARSSLAARRLCEAAIHALGVFGDPHAIPALARTLKTTSHQGLRIQIIQALALIGTPQAIPPLLRTLREPTTFNNRDARKAAAQALGRVDDISAVRPLIDLLLAERDLDVQREIACSLGELHDPRAIPALHVLLNRLPDETYTHTRLRTTVNDALVKLHASSG
ncbi:MAG: HEAT repeat domain-containing protein [Chloroflexi bacterium]|nr:HEAT repeat domain-containing protein [Chloroflexota bacterium]